MRRSNLTTFLAALLGLALVLGIVVSAPQVRAAPGIANLTPVIPATPTPEPPPPTALTLPTPEPPPTATPWPTHEPRRRSTPTATPNPTATPPPTATPEPWLTNIRVTKRADQAIRRYGEDVVFTIVGENVGSHTAFDVVVTDDVPAVFAILGIDSTKGDVIAEGQRVTSYPSRLEPGEQVALVIRARVNPAARPGTYPNTARITTTTAGDDPGDNSSTVEILIPPASLPRTGLTQQSPLDTAAPYIPWVIAALCIAALGGTLLFVARRRTMLPATAAAPLEVISVPAPVASAAPVVASPREPSRLQPAAPAPPTAPGFGPDLPPPAPIQPLPPRASNDRDAALRYVRAEPADPEGEGEHRCDAWPSSSCR